MRFRIDLKIFLFIVLFYFSKQIEIYSIIMFFAIIHELGHLLAGLILKMKPEKMEIVPYGVSLSFKVMPNDYNEKVKPILVALAGPLTNLIIMLAVLHLNINIFDGFIIAYANLLLILFNLLPIYPLDGGRIIKGILHIFFGRKKAEKYTNTISFISLLIITFVASIVIYKVENIAIFLIVMVLWWIFIKEDHLYKKREKIYDLVEKF